MKKQAYLYIAWTQALVATLGSLFLSVVLHWTPCVLCWYQRTMMYPLAIILAVAILKEISDIEWVVLPLSFVGMAIAVYHNLLQYKILPESYAPCTTGASCTIPYHFWFGFLTVPLLSLVAFIVITASMLAYRKAKA